MNDLSRNLSVLAYEKKLKSLLAEQLDLELAIVIGSQVLGNATLQSDWDIAIRWIKKSTL